MLDILQKLASVDSTSENAISPSNTVVWNRVEFSLNKELLRNEIYPSVVRVELPAEKRVLNKNSVFGYIDSRMMPEGYGWRLANDGLAFEIHVPLDPELRCCYLEEGGVEYSFIWPV